MKRLAAAFKPESKYRAFFLSITILGLAHGLYVNETIVEKYTTE